MRFYTLIAVFIFSNYYILYSQGTQLLRQPTVSSTHITFVYANDLWQVDRNGGDAIRLTTNEGYESSPHYSPDEKWIAFSAEYGGNTDVYMMPSAGGEPQRLTWHPSGDIVQGWTPDGEVLFRSSREAHPTQTNKFYTVSREGGLPKAVAIPRAAYGEMSPDGRMIAYTPITSWDPEWRNYRGGQAMPIWMVDLQTKELMRTPQPTQERHLDPVWWNNKVYYLSERDYASNIWSFDPATKAEAQLTKHQKFDVKSLDACSDAIVYEQGGYLHLLDPKSGVSKQLVINVRGDMNFARPRWETIKGNEWNNVAVSPNGKRVIFEHRGEIFTIPKENGSWRNLTNSPGVADRSPIWSPKGDQIAWFSDASGEYQLHIADQKGLNKKSYDLPDPTFFFTPDWSPDGKHLAFTDTDYNIWIFNTESGTSQKVATDRYAHPNRSMNPMWSPDSKWIAYARQLESHFKAIFAYNIDSQETIQLTDGIADAISPIWDQNGEYLYFLASTNYGLNSGWLDMSSYDPQVSRHLYALLLNKEVESPLLVKSDEEEIEEESESDEDDSDEDDSDEDDSNKEESDEEESDKDNSDESKEKEEVIINIDVENIASRIVAMDLPDKNFIALERAPEHSVFVWEVLPNGEGTVLHHYDTKKQEAKTFTKGINRLQSSFDGSHLLFRKGANHFLVETSSPPKDKDGQLSATPKVKIDPQAEYHQIFKEGWRYMRDFLYVDNVHGAPWDKIYEWYSPWIDDVRHRTDLNYVVDIMSGEVAIGHSYVSGGDMPDIDRVPVGLLGCDFELENGYYKIAKIYTGESWNPNINAPLHLPGKNVKEGDYLLAINGQPLKAPTNPYELLEQTSGQATLLSIGETTDLSEATDVLVKPTANEYRLRSVNWVESNRRKVDELSKGKLAYIYVPNTSGNGFQSFNRYYFSQQDKKGAIIDERNNGGGSAADYMIDIMSRELFGYFNSRAGDNRPWTTPMAGIWGPKVMLINERSGSGGDLLPYMFHAKELGPLVGTRTWGGLVGTWDTPPFVDGGRMVAPRGGFFDVDGEWAVEGEGIAPDIEVIQEPKLVLEGRDPQLERAVQEALRLIQEEGEFELKPEPAAPMRWKRPEGFRK